MLLNSKPCIDAQLEELKDRVAKLAKDPVLAIVQVGDDPASNAYIRNKMKVCNQVGIDVQHYVLAERISEHIVLELIDGLNDNDDVDGILVQLPLPDHLDEDKIINTIAFNKDVDGLTKHNQGLFYTGYPHAITPCTPRGIMELLDYYNVELDGADVVVINRSDVVGKPLIKLLLDRNASVTVLHSHSKHISHFVEYADVVITAIGIPDYFDHNSFRGPCTVVDVSMNRHPVTNKLCGDVDKDSYDRLMLMPGMDIVPVPGGVGPMTVLSLVKNLLDIVGC